MQRLPALTIHQPWAWCIALETLPSDPPRRPKRLENRDRKAPRPLWGKRLAIHAGRRYDDEAAAELRRAGVEVPDHDATALGAVVAVATLRCCSTWRPGRDHPQRFWWQGPVAWVLDDVRPLREPAPCRGYPKIWRLRLPLDQTRFVEARL